MSEVIQVKFFDGRGGEDNPKMRGFLASLDPSSIVDVKAAAGPEGLNLPGEIFRSVHMNMVIYKQSVAELDDITKEHAASYGGVFGSEG